jgi:hypothetical protein
MVSAAIVGIASLGMAGLACSEEDAPIQYPAEPLPLVILTPSSPIEPLPVVILTPGAPVEAIKGAALRPLRNLRLNAIGTRALAPDEQRLPQQFINGPYEVIVAKPGPPRNVPLAKGDDK